MAFPCQGKPESEWCERKGIFDPVGDYHTCIPRVGSDVEITQRIYKPKFHFPTHLTCPFCPAQALPEWETMHYIFNNVRFRDGVRMKKYICPAKHSFFVEAKPEREEEHADSLHGRCV